MFFCQRPGEILHHHDFISISIKKENCDVKFIQFIHKPPPAGPHANNSGDVLPACPMLPHDGHYQLIPTIWHGTIHLQNSLSDPILKKPETALIKITNDLLIAADLATLVF